ncbi:hypothetical protein KSC_000430 [Ktedonobacter sp. SOSP1-52]|nr:hypothetical protein KSC_000430 [Ktedonobacter sp. SOSP1-52]
MTKTYLLTAGRGGDHIADLHLLVRDHNAVNQQLDQLPLLLKGRLSQALLNTLTKRINGLDHGGQFVVAPHTGL